jgi:hypothetical protein
MVTVTPENISHMIWFIKEKITDVHSSDRDKYTLYGTQNPVEPYNKKDSRIFQYILNPRQRTYLQTLFELCPASRLAIFNEILSMQDFFITPTYAGLCEYYHYYDKLSLPLAAIKAQVVYSLELHLCSNYQYSVPTGVVDEPLLL